MHFSNGYIIIQQRLRKEFCEAADNKTRFRIIAQSRSYGYDRLARDFQIEMDTNE
jgi:hypothetical protein